MYNKFVVSETWKIEMSCDRCIINVLGVSSVHWLHILFADDIDLELRLARFEHLMERRLLLLNSVLLRQNPHNVHEWHKRVLLYEGKPREVIWGICTIRCLHIVLWPLISGVCKLLFPLGFSDILCSLQMISHVPLPARPSPSCGWGSVPGQSLWDLWWKNCDWDRFFSEHSVFPCE